MYRFSKVNLAATTLFSWLLCSTPASAYIGPGAGLSALGTLVAVLGACLLLVVGFIWYPVKRLLNRNKGKPGADGETSSKIED